jgi:hypothetical protein
MLLEFSAVWYLCSQIASPYSCFLTSAPITTRDGECFHHRRTGEVCVFHMRLCWCAFSSHAAIWSLNSLFSAVWYLCSQIASPYSCFLSLVQCDTCVARLLHHIHASWLQLPLTTRDGECFHHRRTGEVCIFHLRLCWCAFSSHAVIWFWIPCLVQCDTCVARLLHHIHASWVSIYVFPLQNYFYWIIA